MQESSSTQVQFSESAFQNWRFVEFNSRQDLIANIAIVLEQKKEEYARHITLEMGKPIAQSLAEVSKCALMCQYYAHVENPFLVKQGIEEQPLSRIIFEPLGIILGIMPWNFPFWQVLRFAIPAILAGNVVMLKHASICKKSGELIEDLFMEAGFPKDIFTFMDVSHSEIEELISHPKIRGISVTGSEAAGRKIAEIAGRNLKKCVLELGGNDAFIILADANVPQAAKDAALGRLQNTGQTCVASKRFIVHEHVFERFIPLFIEEFRKYKNGDLLDPSTNLGKLARVDLADELEVQYKNAIEQGAKIILPLQRSGNVVFEPGILLMNRENTMADIEVFGPLAMVFIAKDDKDAMDIANSSSFGLANAVYTTNREKAEYFANHLESGSVAINQIFRSDVRMPFGGRKNSGYGVELSLQALHEFTAPKSIVGHVI